MNQADLIKLATLIRACPLTENSVHYFGLTAPGPANVDLPLDTALIVRCDFSMPTGRGTVGLRFRIIPADGVEADGKTVYLVNVLPDMHPTVIREGLARGVEWLAKHLQAYLREELI